MKAQHLVDERRFAAKLMEIGKAIRSAVERSAIEAAYTATGDCQVRLSGENPDAPLEVVLFYQPLGGNEKDGEELRTFSVEEAFRERMAAIQAEMDDDQYIIGQLQDDLLHLAAASEALRRLADEIDQFGNECGAKVSGRRLR